MRELPPADPGIPDDRSATRYLGWLARQLREGPAVSGAHLAIRDDKLDAVHARLKETPLVAAVTSPAAMLRNFEEHVAKNMYTSAVPMKSNADDA